MVTFDELTHKYYDGDKELISVTTLLRKYGLSPDYSMVPEEVLSASAYKGTLVHKEIEEYVKERKMGFTEELQWFINWYVNNNVEFIASEKLVHNDVVAGTCDLLVKMHGKIVRIDIKTTSVVHKDSCSWQISLYDYLDDIKADEFMVLHLGTNCLREVPVEAKPIKAIDEIMESERSGEVNLTSLPTIRLSSEQLTAITTAETKYALAKRIKEEADKLLEQINEGLIRAFEESGVKTFENDVVKITYVAPVTKDVVDTAKFKKEFEDVYKKVLKKSTSKASVRITMKGGSADDSERN